MLASFVFDSNLFFVTGTRHGSHVAASSEGEARRIFHHVYNGESIIHLSDVRGKIYQKHYPYIGS